MINMNPMQFISLLRGRNPQEIVMSMVQNNGINVPSAEATVDASAAATQGTFTFSKVIKVRPSCCNVDNTANLTFINSGVPATFASANVSVIKL